MKVLCGYRKEVRKLEEKISRIDEIDAYYILKNNPVDPETARKDIEFLLEKLYDAIFALCMIEVKLNTPSVECHNIAKSTRESLKETR
jgi:hypothetical protein